VAQQRERELQPIAPARNAAPATLAVLIWSVGDVDGLVSVAHQTA